MNNLSCAIQFTFNSKKNKSKRVSMKTDKI